MDQQQQSRWRPTRRQLVWTGVFAALLFLGVVICGYLFGWKWTGLPKRTFWDWLDLLIVPVVLAIGGYLFTRSENQRTREDADMQRTLDRELADERRQDDMLQAYLEGMSQMLTDKEQPLNSAQPGDTLSTVARARTLAVLSRVDGRRKRSVLEFLYEANLISKSNRVIELGSRDFEFSTADLSGADLRGAFLRYACLGGETTGANLAGADLRGADLTGADLTHATLRGTNLSGAIMSGVADISNRGQTKLTLADLTSADLSGVRGIPNEVQGVTNEEVNLQTPLLQLAIMPNGEKYEDWINDKVGSGKDE